jgi:hypothetical protein
MCRFKSMTPRNMKRRGKCHKRHGHDAKMTRHDDRAVITQPVGNQRETNTHDTMTLDSSKWRYKGEKRAMKQNERKLRTETAGRQVLTTMSVMPSWMGEI